MKYTRTAYAEINVRYTLREIVNDARLTDLPTFNSGLHAHPGRDRQKVRITVIVEAVKTQRRKGAKS